MGCQSDVNIGEYLTFSVCTHDPDTGVLTDADSAPSYRIYEDETATAILTGTMSILDDVNTTGFYTERVLCSVANGFEEGKSYTVYIQATVDGDTGGICYGFRAQKQFLHKNSSKTFDAATDSLEAIRDALRAASLEETLAANTIEIRRGDTMSETISGLGSLAGRSKLWFTVKKQPDSDTDAEAIIQIEETAGLVYLNEADASARAANGSITVNDESAGDITVALDEAETDDLPLRANLVYDVQVLVSGTVTTLRKATFSVLTDVTRAIV